MDAPEREDAGELELTLRGFSPAELRACAEKRCACYGYRVSKAEIRPCMVSAGGRVRLYEGRFVAARA
ncbi:MAG TPA: hypothetical protein VFB42_01960 [Gaiellaceae bacterium]|nr:hypothetical protein [Gaiellaceae bacterium]